MRSKSATKSAFAWHVDENFVASCQQTCCTLIVETSEDIARLFSHAMALFKAVAWALLFFTNIYAQVCCKLTKQVVRSLQMTSCNKSDLFRLGELDKFVIIQLLVSLTCMLQQGSKIDNMRQGCVVFDSVMRDKYR